MTDKPVLCGVILAAGASARMGRDKALLPWPPGSASETLLKVNIDALRPFSAEVLVVAGHNAASLAPVVEACGARLVVNPDPERGQFSSMQTGLRELVARGWQAAMITPVDSPPLSHASLEELCQAFVLARKRQIWAVAPERNGRRGHPLIAGRELIDAFLAAPVTSNAREVRHANAERLEFFAVADVGLGCDLNTPEQYASAAVQSGRSS
jgi:molybdenum cofactor cytidylyltransferase